MSRRDDLSPEDRRIWARVAGSVTPPRSRKPARIVAGATDPAPALGPDSGHAGKRATSKPAVATPTVAPVPRPPVRARGPAEPLEPRRQRRLSRERDPIDARIDLHGFGRFEAEDQLRAFLLGSQARGLRAVLVITGQGRRGGGVIRASFEEWLHAASLRGVVSGFSSAGRRHGGEGAFYVTLKRRT